MTSHLVAPGDVTWREGIPEAEVNYIQSGPVLSHAEQFDALRGVHPFVRSTFGPGFWVMTRGDLIRDALQQADLFSSSIVTPMDPDPPYLWIPEMLDPPEHTRWRQLLAPFFAPRVIERMEDTVRERCVSIIESFADRGHCDFLRDFAWRYPTTIFMELMGLPLDGLEQFLAWEHDILHLTFDEDPDRSRATGAMVAVQEYFSGLIEEKRARPGDDLLTAALDWKIDGQPVPHEELLSFCLLMFMAGLDTVSIQLAYSFHHLATHPADRARLVAEPAIIPSAVEELLRAYAFVAPGRKATRDADFHGCPVKAGDLALLPLCGANRDPSLFPDGDQVILDRTPNSHIAFGLGPHRCLGSHLARRELRIALEEWHARIPDYHLTEGVDVVEHGGMFGIDVLSLTWDR